MARFWVMTAGSSGFVNDNGAGWRELVEHLGLDPDAPCDRPDLIEDGAVTGWCWDPETPTEINVYIQDVGRRQIREVGP